VYDTPKGMVKLVV